MSTEHSTSPSSHVAPGVRAPLTAAEKLALSRQALQTALFPPPKPKKPGVIGSLRKLWPAGRKEAKASGPASVSAALAQSAPAADGTAPRLLVQREQQKNKGVAQAAASKASAISNLQQAVSGVFDRIGSLMSTVVKSRWRRHPFNWALQVGEPLLEAEIRRHPIPWLAGAAAAGAAFVLLNPLKWRQSRQMVSSVLGQEVRVLATSGLVFLATSVLGDWLRRSGADQSEPGQS